MGLCVRCTRYVRCSGHHTMQGPGPQSFMFCDRNLWSNLWVSPTPLNLHVSTVVPAVRPLRSPDPLLSSLTGPLPYCPFSKRNFLAQSLLLYSLKVSLAPNTEELRTLHGCTMSFILWPQIAFPKSPPHSWAPVTWTLVSPSGLFCPLTVVHAVPFACNAFLLISTWWNLANKCVSFLLRHLANHAYSSWLTDTLPLHPYPYRSIHV